MAAVWKRTRDRKKTHEVEKIKNEKYPKHVDRNNLTLGNNFLSVSVVGKFDLHSFFPDVCIFFWRAISFII